MIEIANRRRKIAARHFRFRHCGERSVPGAEVNLEGPAVIAGGEHIRVTIGIEIGRDDRPREITSGIAATAAESPIATAQGHTDAVEFSRHHVQKRIMVKESNGDEKLPDRVNDRWAKGAITLAQQGRRMRTTDQKIWLTIAIQICRNESPAGASRVNHCRRKRAVPIAQEHLHHA